MLTTAFSNWKIKGIKSLGVGAPDETLLKACSDVMSVASKALFESGDTDCLQYGPNLGDEQGLKELAKFLTSELHDEVKVENLIFTAGAAQGLMYTVNTFFDRGDLALAEDPSYYIGLKMLEKDAGLNLLPVTTEEDGINVDEVDKILTQNINKEKLLSSKKLYSAVIYIIPTFNNPRGTILSEAKCFQLIKVLRKHKALAICDDVYNLNYFMDEKAPFVTPSPKRLFAYDKETDADYQGNVISNGSFSKSLGPGLRLGWIEAPKHVISRFDSSGYVNSGGTFNHLTSRIVCEAIKLGLVSKHLAAVREVYHSRMNALCDAVDQYLPSAKYTRPKGGYFIWLTFPESVDAKEVFDMCKEKYKVSAPGGKKFSCVGNFKNCTRLSFAYFQEDVLRECVQKLGMAFDEVVKK